MQTKRKPLAKSYTSRYSAKKSYGVGGAVMTLGKNLLQGKKLGSGAFKGVFQAGITPMSGVGAGIGLAGALAGKSKKPWLQKVGKGLGVAGGLAGLFTGGGGGGALSGLAGKFANSGAGGALSNLAGKFAGSGGGQALSKFAGNFAGLDKTLGGIGAAGGGNPLLGLVKNFIPSKTGANGMKVYASGGMIPNMRVLKSMEDGGVHNGDPVKEGHPRITTTTTADSEYVEDKPLTGGNAAQGTIGAINPNFNIGTDSLDQLSDEQKNSILSSSFGDRYLSGEGTLDEQYGVYTTKVNNFLNDNPTEALASINRMMETNENFKTKLKDAKTDQEKLDITRTMMTDGKIGDFHGQLLSQDFKTPLPQFHTPNTSNIRGSKYPNVLIGSGERGLEESQIPQYLAAAEAAGISSEELSQDTDRTREFLNSYLDENGSQNTSPTTTSEGGFNTGGMDQYYIDQGKEGVKNLLSSREGEQKDRHLEFMKTNNPKQYAQVMALEGLKEYNEANGTDFGKISDMEDHQADAIRQENEASKEGHMAAIAEEQRPAFLDEYFKSKGITDPTLKQREDADTAYEINPDMFKPKAMQTIKAPSFSNNPYIQAYGGKVRVMKNGGSFGALSSLIR